MAEVRCLQTTGLDAYECARLAESTRSVPVGICGRESPRCGRCHGCQQNNSWARNPGGATRIVEAGIFFWSLNCRTLSICFRKNSIIFSTCVSIMMSFTRSLFGNFFLMRFIPPTRSSLDLSHSTWVLMESMVFAISRSVARGILFVNVSQRVLQVWQRLRGIATVIHDDHSGITWSFLIQGSKDALVVEAVRHFAWLNLVKFGARHWIAWRVSPLHVLVSHCYLYGRGLISTLLDWLKILGYPLVVVSDFI